MTTDRSSEIIEKIRALKPSFGEMGLKRVRVFGSVARGEAGPDSDVDIIVDFCETPGLLRFINVKHQLEDRLGCTVDMTTAKGLHPLIKEDALREATDV